jgi:cytoskeleton protein RodZ
VNEATKGPGNLLRAEREALGVTVREVADTLNLSITIVQALEADDYKRLPGTVFARGYIRAYARLLDLDPVPLLDLFPGQANGSDAAPVAHDAGFAEWVRRRPGLVLSVIAIVVVGGLAGLGALVWPEDGIDSLWRSSENQTIEVPAADTTGEWGWNEGAEAAPEDGALVPEEAKLPVAPGGETPADGTAAGDPEAQDGADGAAGAGDNPTDASGADAASAAGATIDASGRPVVEGAAEPGSDGRVRRLTTSGEQRLALDFSADSWVEIRDPGGRMLYSNLNKAGTGVELVGQGPFRILLGYAPGVTLAFEGEPVALAPHTRNNVATLVLGQ